MLYTYFMNGFHLPAPCSTTSENSETSKNGQENANAKDETDPKTNILKASLPHVHEHGWSRQTLVKGCESAGLSTAAQGMFPRGGVELVEYFYDDCNQELSAYLKDLNKASDRKKLEYALVRDAIEMRLRLITPYLDHWPQAMALMALPQNARESLRNLYNLVDEICHHLGTHSTNVTWYSERLRLAAVYKATEFFMIQDDDEDFQNTWQFLDRRLSEIEAASKCADVAKGNLKNFIAVLQAGTIVGQNILSLNRNKP